MNSDEFLDNLEENQVVETRELSEFELRLKQAQYYQLLLHNDFFDTKDVVAQQIQDEVHAFITRRCEELMGLRSESGYVGYESPFTEDEVDALKAIAAKVRERPSIAVPKKVGRPPKEPPKEVPAPAKSAVSKNRLKKVAVPEDLRDSVPQTQKTQPPEAKVVSLAPNSLSLVPPKDKVVEEMLGEGADGVARKKVGNRYFKQVIAASGEPVLNAEGEPVWADITPQAVDPNNKPLPMPTGVHMTYVMEAKGAEHESLFGGNGNFNAILAQAGKMPLSK